ncbi:MAG: hypothetical protein M0038_12830 [Pseudomonadota bacterium]|jgi:hypothetical protein|nr:hypothetical protein [Pseudomonadota bacterium]
MNIRPLSLLVLGGALLLGGCAAGPAPQGGRVAAQPPCAGGAEAPGHRPSCSPFARRYSARELRQTGHVNAARALAALDPAVTAQGP